MLGHAASFCYLHLSWITKFKDERINEMNSGLSSKKMSLCKWPIQIENAILILLTLL